MKKRSKFRKIYDNAHDALRTNLTRYKIPNAFPYIFLAQNLHF